MIKKTIITTLLLVTSLSGYPLQAAMYFAGYTGSKPTFEGPSVVTVSNQADPMNYYENNYGRHSPRQGQWGSQPPLKPSNGFRDFRYADNF